MNKCIIDTGPMVALFDSSDQYHEKAVSFIKGYSGSLLTTHACVTEVIYLLDFSKQAQLDFLSWVGKSAVELVHIENSDVLKMIQIFSKYADLPMDYADGTLILTAEKMNIKQIATIDSDFEIYRMHRNKKFEILIGR